MTTIGIVRVDQPSTEEGISRMNRLWGEFERYMSCDPATEPSAELREWYQGKQITIEPTSALMNLVEGKLWCLLVRDVTQGDD